MAAKFLIKRREFHEIKRRAFGYGRVMSYGPWRTVSVQTCEDNARFVAQQENRRPGLFQVAIFHGGKKLS